MTIAAARVYADGRRLRRLRVHEADDRPMQAHQFASIGLVDPEPPGRAVPTAIEGLYGMNFEFMPELRWRYGYFVVLGMVVAVCAGLFITFRRAKWI